MKVLFFDRDNNQRLRTMAMPVTPSVGDRVVLSGIAKRSGRHGDEVWRVHERQWLLDPSGNQTLFVALTRVESRAAGAEDANDANGVDDADDADEAT